MDSSDDDSYAGSATSIAEEQSQSDSQVITAIQSAFDPLPLDRAIVIEAQHSGLLNAMTQDLERLKREADELCARAPAQLSEMNSLIKKTEANLDWLVSRSTALALKMKTKSPIEYAQAEARVVYRDDSP